MLCIPSAFRTILALAIPLGVAGAAGAATLVVESDKLVYLVGETIQLTVTGDSEGAAGTSIVGRLEYSAALTETVTSSQTQHTSFDGNFPWTPAALPVGDGFATVFNQGFLLNPETVDQLQIATATLVAEAAGVVSVGFDVSSPWELNFFGLTSAPGTSFTIVPEPATAALLALGMAGLALVGRGRRT